ncbi:CPBP family intramembrane metalloprotease [bacterium]|nr:CPBP family intramembrane metalloprotease [bacterium]
MTPPVTALVLGLAATGRGGDVLGEPSELELVTRTPWLGGIVVVLLLAGLVVDLRLLQQVLRPRHPGAPALPDRVPRKPWGLREFVAGTALLLLLLVTASYLVAVTANLVRLDETATWIAFLSGEVALRLVLLAGAAIALRRAWPDWADWIGLRPWRPGAGLRRGGAGYLAALPPVVLAIAAVEWIARAWRIPLDRQPVVDLLLSADSLLVVGLVGIFAVVVAPVFEETFFRGFAYPALKQRLGRGAGLLVTALLFSLAHFHLPSVLPLFVLGLALGLAYETTGSLLVPIVLHALFNAGNIGMVLALR